jgi:CBS domain-containing protein
MIDSSEHGAAEKTSVLYRLAAFQYHERLKNVMVTDVYTCAADDSVQPVAEEMAKRKISSVVITDSEERVLGIATERDMLKKVVAKGCPSILDTRIAQIMTPHPVTLAPFDTLFDALSIFARHDIKHLPIVDGEKLVGLITFRQLLKLRHFEPLVLIGDLQKAESIADFQRIRREMIHLTRKRLASNVDPTDIVAMLSLVNASIHKRLLRRSLSEQGAPPPVDFCCFVTGSHGRRENLLFPDQDHCMIIDDYDDAHYNEYDQYFLKLSLRFADLLNTVGFPYCSGGIMGQNPLWRKRLSEWRAHVACIFRDQGPYKVRYLTLLFDSSYLYGKKTLFTDYIEDAFARLSQSHTAIRQMRDEEQGLHKVPLGLFGSFVTEKNGDHKGEIDMKKSGLIFVIEAARVLALRHGIRDTSTLGRIRALVEKGVLHEDDSEYFENAYRVILYQTLKAQVDNYLRQESHDYYLNPQDLSSRHQNQLKQAFKAISDLQDIVGAELGELIL